jgi:hypothetical protein
VKESERTERRRRMKGGQEKGEDRQRGEGTVRALVERERARERNERSAQGRNERTKEPHDGKCKVE